MVSLIIIFRNTKLHFFFLVKIIWIAGCCFRKMQIYPKGKGSGTGNHISLYLALADPTNFPIGTQQIYVEFTLRIIDQIYSNNYYAKGIKFSSPLLSTYWFNSILLL